MDNWTCPCDQCMGVVEWPPGRCEKISPGGGLQCVLEEHSTRGHVFIHETWKQTDEKRHFS